MRYIDLFSGCGGLSLGLERAGFELALAVEKSDMAGETFYHNFVRRIGSKEEWAAFCALPPHEQAKQKIVVDEVGRLLNDPKLGRWLKTQDIDLVAGGPPCQGFSMAGRRNPDDIRNKLPWQFLEIVEMLQPKAVLIENVVGMSHNFLKHDKEAPFNQLKQALEQIGPGYKAQQVQFNAMNFGAPQHRPRVLLLALRKDVAGDFWFADSIWRSEHDEGGLRKDRPDIAPLATFFGKDIRTVKDAIWDLGDDGYKYTAGNKLYTNKHGQLAAELRKGLDWMPTPVAKSGLDLSLHNHTLRNHNAQITERFRLYQVLRDCGLPSRILNIPKTHTKAAARAMLRDLIDGTGFKGIFTAPDGTMMAKNKKELVDLIASLGTKKHSQRPLRWDQPAPTVVSLPDDFVHPALPRTLTVRELARFQTFPDNFVFRAKETTGSHRRRFEVPQYTQVGNAVPPIMAEAVGRQVMSLLKASAKSRRGKRVA